MIFSYEAGSEARRMALYDLIRNQQGDVIELKALPQSQEVESPPIEAVVRGFKRGQETRASRSAQ